MNIELTDMEFRRLLDLVYVGNWILNSTKGDKRIEEFDKLESKIFSYCLKTGMYTLFEVNDGEILPSVNMPRAVFMKRSWITRIRSFMRFLLRNSQDEYEFCAISPENFNELATRIDEYIEELRKTA
jgi:hypothetical protein